MNLIVVCIHQLQCNDAYIKPHFQTSSSQKRIDLNGDQISWNNNITAASDWVWSCDNIIPCLHVLVREGAVRFMYVREGAVRFMYVITIRAPS